MPEDWVELSDDELTAPDRAAELARDRPRFYVGLLGLAAGLGALLAAVLSDVFQGLRGTQGSFGLYNVLLLLLGLAFVAAGAVAIRGAMRGGVVEAAPSGS
jgi:hypothetical protein